MGNYFANYLNDFIARFDGPLHFRLIMQPLMAILLAARDGTRDAREGRSAYLWTLLSDPVQRRYLLADGWKGISRIFILAYALDVVYQLIEWHGLKALEALLTAVVLAVVPYVLLRGPINRLMRLIHVHGKQVQDRKA
jgi:hypothetical protein